MHTTRSNLIYLREESDLSIDLHTVGGPDVTFFFTRISTLIRRPTFFALTSAPYRCPAAQLQYNTSTSTIPFTAAMTMMMYDA